MQKTIEALRDSHETLASLVRSLDEINATSTDTIARRLQHDARDVLLHARDQVDRLWDLAYQWKGTSIENQPESECPSCGPACDD